MTELLLSGLGTAFGWHAMLSVGQCDSHLCHRSSTDRLAVVASHHCGVSVLGLQSRHAWHTTQPALLFNRLGKSGRSAAATACHWLAATPSVTPSEALA